MTVWGSRDPLILDTAEAPREAFKTGTLEQLPDFAIGGERNYGRKWPSRRRIWLLTKVRKEKVAGEGFGWITKRFLSAGV